MSTVIIKYNAGNIHSVRIALNRLGVEPLVTDDPDQIRSAERVIFPGVGEASTAMEYLDKNNMTDVIKSLEQPFLGICLGLQLMCAHSEENDTKCLSVFDVAVKRFPPRDKVPHMGWNTTTSKRPDPLLAGLPEQPWYYFVHSYCAPIGPETLATCLHGESFAAIVRQGNFYGAQFHPERSARNGARLLANFLELT